MTIKHPVKKETYNDKHRNILGKNDVIHTGSICIIVHYPDNLYFGSIKLILSYLLFSGEQCDPCALLSCFCLITACILILLCVCFQVELSGYQNQ